jgi:hypothetical protein
VPAKLDRCVDDIKAKGDVENPWAVCNASIGKETKEHHNPLDIPFGYEVNGRGTVKEQIIQEKVNANRMVPVFNPPIKDGKIEPQINKTTKGIGGLEGQIGKPVKNPQPSILWKDILDAQLKRNVKEPKL